MPAIESHIERSLLPRGLIARRKIAATTHQYAFELGQSVTLLCTAEPAVVIGRAELAGRPDEFTIALVGVDVPPLTVQPHQIARETRPSGGRARIFTATWRFQVGDTVEFAGSLAVITGRQRSAMGQEIYSIFLLGVRERPHRIVRGVALRSLH